MARSALAYQQSYQSEAYQSWPEYAPARPEQRERRDLRVLQGQGRTAQAQALAPIWRRVFVFAFVAVVLIGAIWIARVALTEATMQMMANTDQLSQSIAAERLAGTQLEVEYSRTTNPATVQDAAAVQLGMSADEQVEYINVATGA